MFIAANHRIQSTTSSHQLHRKAIYAFTLLVAALLHPLNARAIEFPETPEAQSTSVAQLANILRVGDIVFIRVTAKPFREVANATGTWTNHVGIVTSIDGVEPMIGESTFPFSRTTPLTKFVARSEYGHVAITRLKANLSAQQVQRIQLGVKERSGIFYDTGFNLHSHKEFCSRFVYEVVREATGISVGEVETFNAMLASRPDINLRFWKVWYFGRIPWDRETITPASMLNSPNLNLIFNANIDTTTKPGKA